MALAASASPGIERGKAKIHLCGSYHAGVQATRVKSKQTKTAEANAAKAKCETAKVLTTAGVTAMDQGQSALAMHQFAEAIKVVDEDTLAQESNRLRLGMLARSVPGLGAILTGHTWWVVSAAFSPDGKRVVTASGDK